LNDQDYDTATYHATRIFKQEKNGSMTIETNWFETLCNGWAQKPPLREGDKLVAISRLIDKYALHNCQWWSTLYSQRADSGESRKQ